MTHQGSDASFYLRFAAGGLAIAALFVVGSIALGSGFTGASDGLFAVGVLAAAVAALFTRPSVLRKRSIRESEVDGDDPESDGDGGSGRTEEGAAPRPTTGDSDPARQARIGVGLLVLAVVSLAVSAALTLLG